MTKAWNWVLLEGVDQKISKTTTITSFENQSRTGVVLEQEEEEKTICTFLLL